MIAVAVTTSFSRDVFHAHEPRPDLIVTDFEEFLSGPGRPLIG
jgi:hypothetical protein